MGPREPSSLAPEQATTESLIRLASEFGTAFRCSRLGKRHPQPDSRQERSQGPLTGSSRSHSQTAAAPSRKRTRRSLSMRRLQDWAAPIRSDILRRRCSAARSPHTAGALVLGLAGSKRCRATGRAKPSRPQYPPAIRVRSNPTRKTFQEDKAPCV